MKKYISISLLVLFSCGSRNVNKSKSSQQINETVKQQEMAQKSTEIKQSEQTEAKIEKVEISQTEKATEETNKESSESNSNKTSSETNTKTVKKTIYYPSGQKKSETETSENYSKLLDENESIKSTVEKLKIEKESIALENKSLKSEVSNLQMWNKNLSDTTKEFSRMYDEKKIELEKQTERKAYPFWFWIAIGFFLRILVGAAWNYIKAYRAGLSK